MVTPQQARMFPRQLPFAPTVHQLHRNGRLFPPNDLRCQAPIERMSNIAH
jgi:hypothetical protein